MFKTIAFVVGLLSIALGAGLLGARADYKREAPGRAWCAARGYQEFRVKYAMLCVDPKTRQVYFPE